MWLAKNKDNKLYLFSTKPLRCEGEWLIKDSDLSSSWSQELDSSLFSPIEWESLFSHIKWENEPIEVRLIKMGW